MDNKDTKKKGVDLTDKTLLSEFPHPVSWSDSTGEYFKKPSKDESTKPVKHLDLGKILKLG